MSGWKRCVVVWVGLWSLSLGGFVPPVIEDDVEVRWGACWVLGPLAAGPGVRAELGPEEDLGRLVWGGKGLRRKASYRGDSGKVRWQELDVPGGSSAAELGRVDFVRHFAPKDGGASGWSDNQAVYVYRSLEAKSAGVVYLKVGSDDGRRIWFNGTLVHQRGNGNGVHLEEADLALRVKPGINHLLFKVVNVGGAWDLRVRKGAKLEVLPIGKTLERAVNFVLRDQLVDGSWRGYENYGAGYTAFTCYALMKAGLDVGHPSLQRGLAFVRARECRETYSIAVKLLALAEAGEEDGEVARLGGELVQLQESSGLYGYPVHPASGQVLPVDLSNALFAALALRAAELRGARVAKKVWADLVDGTLRCREPEPDDVGAAGRGFGYGLRGTATGSMTTAGMSVLLMAREKLGRKAGRAMEQPLEEGLTWLENNLEWGRNPGHVHGSFPYYFIYGMERLGALLGTNTLGNTEWYRAGAKYLVGKQAQRGNFDEPPDVHGNVTRDTLPAMMFLARATAPTSGVETTLPEQVLTAEGEPARVRWRILGRGPYRAWITGFGVLEDELLWPSDAGRRPRVVRVRYMLRSPGAADEVELASVDAEAEGDSAARRGQVQFQVETGGRWEIVPRVTLLRRESDVRTSEVDVVGEALALDVQAPADEAALGYARDGLENLALVGTASASSVNGGDVAALGIDGRQGTRWRCAAGDATPWLRIELPRAVSADRLVLSHALPSLAGAEAPGVREVELRLEGPNAWTARVGMNPDRMRKTEVRFPKRLRVRAVELRVLDWDVLGAAGAPENTQAQGAPAVGLGEVELLLNRGG